MNRYKILRVGRGNVFFITTILAESAEDAVRFAYRQWECNPIGSYGGGYHFEAELVKEGQIK